MGDWEELGFSSPFSSPWIEKPQGRRRVPLIVAATWAEVVVVRVAWRVPSPSVAPMGSTVL